MGALKDHGIHISIDGKGRWVDNFVERLWRSVKYEETYLRVYDSISDAFASLGWYLAFYSSKQHRQLFDRRTSDSVYYQGAVRMVA